MFKVGDTADRSAEIEILEGDRQPVDEIEIDQEDKSAKDIDDQRSPKDIDDQRSVKEVDDQRSAK
uniref:Uncharacterized protein n=1 Tax=Peronospora matthiolae TaxID=2874970 RepID=A0AAV1UZ98_9STRA